MGVTFIGNPFDQETEYDDSDWEMNAVEEWIMPPQEIAFVDDGERAPIDIILAPEEDSSESLADEDSDEDEDYNPEDDDNYDFDNDVPEFDSYYYDSNEDDDDDDDEEIDYVTYPIREEDSSEPDKPAATDTVHTGESSDTD